MKALSKIKGSKLFGGSLEITDILQGGYKNCFFHAALASLLNHPNGKEIIKNAFSYYNEVTKKYFFYNFSRTLRYMSQGGIFLVDMFMFRLTT